MSRNRGSIPLLIGGPAGGGKTTLARAWCTTQPNARHLELDRILDDISVADDGVSSIQEKAIEVALSQARAELAGGVSVVIDDILDPWDFQTLWAPHLTAFNLVIVLPSLEEAISRAEHRPKAISTSVIRAQHEAASRWSADVCLDTTGLTVDESVQQLISLIRTQPTSPALLSPELGNPS